EGARPWASRAWPFRGASGSMPAMIEIAFAGNPLDRAHLRRLDPAWLETACARGRLLLFSEGKPLVRDGALALLNGAVLRSLGAADAPAMFLGIEDGEPYFAVDLPPAAAHEADALGVFTEIRTALANLPGAEAAVVAEARGLLNWHGTHGFCSACGMKSVVA